MLSRFHSCGPTHDFESVTRIAFKYKLTGFRIKCFPKMISLSIILCLFIHNSRSKHSRKTNNCFQFWLSGTSLCAIVDFLVLEVFNNNDLLSEAVVGLKLFYPKSFRNSFVRSSKPLTLYKLTSHPQNLCQHNLKRVWCLLVLNLDGL